MTYLRIETVADLPPEGPLNDRAREKADLDFKTFADPAKSWEHAKDVAAFSNAIGGVLLIGAHDKTGHLAYPGIVRQSVKDIQGIYEAAAQLCSPSPIVDVIPIPARNVVAVNVEPYLDQLVAAPAKIKDVDGSPGIQKDAWVFPIRRASQTEFIRPENLAMYMNAKVRRSYLLLSKIPESDRMGLVVFYTAPRDIPTQHWDGILEIREARLDVSEISLNNNAITFARAASLNEKVQVRVPLQDIHDVWKTAEERWAMRVAGRFVFTPADAPKRIEYRPLP